MSDNANHMWRGRLLTEMSKEELIDAFCDLQRRYVNVENDLHKSQIDRIQEMHIANYKRKQTNRFPLALSGLRFFGF